MTSRHCRSFARAPARVLGLLYAAVLAASLSGCGGDHVTTPSPAPSPSPTPVTTVIAEGSFSGLEPDGAAIGTFTTPRAGDLAVVVDWTFASNDVDLILTRGECAVEQLLALQCDVADIADSTTAKPERVSIANAPAGPYTVFILNLGSTEESFSYQVLLTTLGTASERGARSSAAQGVADRLFRKGVPKSVVRLR